MPGHVSPSHVTAATGGRRQAGGGGGPAFAGTARPEVALLLCCTHTRLGSDQVGRLRDLLAAGLDWDFLLRLARQHGLVALLYRNLTTVAPECVPPETREALRAEHRASAARGLLLLAETARLLDALHAAGIDAVPLRGPALALAAYGDAALRESEDIDLLVRLAEVPAAAAVLASAGYQAELRGDLTEAQRRALTTLAHHVRFVGQHGRVEVELHWRPISLAVSPHADQWRLLEQTRVVAHAGRGIAALTPEADLLLCCAHAHKHAFWCLKWVCDISELVHSSPGLDYRQVEAEAERLGCLRAVLIGSVLAADLLQAPLPEWLLARARADRQTSRFAAEVARRVQRGEQQDVTVLGRLRDLRLQVRAAGTLSEQARYLLRRIQAQSEGDVASMRLPRTLSGLYRFAKLSRPWRRLGPAD